MQTSTQSELLSPLYKNSLWVFSGVAVGATLGSFQTYFKTGSFFIRDYPSQLEINGSKIEYLINKYPKYPKLIEVINRYRDKEFTFCRNKYLDYISFFHIIPGLLSVSMLSDWKTPNLIIASVPIKTVLLIYLSHFIRRCTEVYFENYHIEPSGHIMAQSINAFSSFYYLKEINKNGTLLQKKIFSVYFAMITLADFAWTYPTAANYHSIADVVAGLTYIGLSAKVVSFYENFLKSRIV